MPHVVIIILNWNGISDTLSLLENLISVQYDHFSVLVVDNASADDSRSRLEQFIKQQATRKSYAISLLSLEQNYGFAEGNNRGVEQAMQAKPDYLLFLNNDTIVAPDFLDVLVTTAETDPKVAAVAPTIFYATQSGEKSKKVWYAGGWLNFFAGGGHHRTVLPDLTKGQRLRPTDFLTGCCLLLKTKALKSVNVAFDPLFFAYGEDVDLSLRLVEAGYTLGYVPESTIWHKLAASSGGPKSSNFWYYNVRNNFLVMARHASWYHWPIFILYFLFYKPVLVSVVGAILRPRPDKWQRLQAICQATEHAIIGKFGKRP